MFKHYGTVVVCVILISCFAIAAMAKSESDKKKQTSQKQGSPKSAPMGILGITVRAGILTIGKTQLNTSLVEEGTKNSEYGDVVQEARDNNEVGGAPAYFPQRTSFLASVALDFGPHYFGFRFEPFVAVGDYVSPGVFIGPTFNFRIKRLYIGLGLGFQSAYKWTGDVDFAIDLFGRIPLEITYYFFDLCGFTLAVAGGYGGTAAKWSGVEDLTFGLTWMVDVSLGVRFPLAY